MSHFPIAFLVSALMIAAIGGCQRMESTGDSGDSDVQPAVQSHGSDAPNGDKASDHPDSPGVAKKAKAANVGKLIFEEVAQKSGLHFTHVSGAKGDFTYPEIMSAGICVADLDGDHDLDIYVPQSGPVPGDDGPRVSNELFLNDGSGKFRNATMGSGADSDAYGMGAFAADVDDDGDLDLLLTNAGSLELLRNNGDATFEDITREAGLADRYGFWLNASFADFNADGKLDVYIANYTEWRPGGDPECKAPGGGPDYCNPTSYDGSKDLLLFGKGDGTFNDVSAASGIQASATRSMGVIAFDADDDGDQDIYVANDGQSNLLWINQGDGTFLEEGLVRGAALNNAGAAEASMGVACVDFDQDGDEDFVISHLERETHTLYRNDNGFFTDVTAQSGLAGWCRPDTGFGIGFADLNLDGHWDLFVANGGVAHPASPRNVDRPYAQADQIALGMIGGKFPVVESLDLDRDGDATAISSTQRPSLVSRGSAFGDFNGDGRIDIVVAAKDAPLRLWQNQTPSASDWIAIRPSREPNGAAEIGAVVRLGGTNRFATVRPQGSYLGNHEDLIRFGSIGKSSATIEVVWSDKSRESFTDLNTGKAHYIAKGTGKPMSTGAMAAATPEPSPEPIRTESDLDTEQVATESPGAQAMSGDLGDIPELHIATLESGVLEAKFDESALAEWCQKAGLPKPPERNGLDGPTWRLVHAALRRTAKSPSAQSFGELAMLYDGHGAWEAAAELYRRAANLAPAESKWWHLLGRTQFDLGRTTESVKSLKEAVRLAPGKAEGIGRLAESQLSAGDAQQAMKNWELFIKLKPDSAVGYLGLARAEEMKGDFEQAMQSAKRTLGLNPKARPALVLAARVAARLGDAESAKSYGVQATKLSKADDPVMQDATDLEMRKFAKSVGYLRQAVNFYKAEGKLLPAMEAAQFLSERRPDDVQNWQMLTWLSLSMKKLDEAGEYATKALRLDPKFAPAWEALARSRMAKNDVPGALKAIESGISANPSYTHGYVTRGVVLGVMKRWPESLKSLERGMAEHPNDIDGLIALAAAQANLRKVKEARATITRAIRLAPKHPLAQRVYLQLHPQR